MGIDAIGFTLGLLAIAVLAAWPVLPGLRRLAAFKTFPPFRDWTARPHPDAAVAVRAGRRLKAATGDTSSARVVVRTAWRNQHSRDLRPSLRASRPLAPLVSVDGVPASWGWGTTELTLAPGEHLIAVTSSHSRCYRTVDLERGERRELDYASAIGDTAHRHHEAGAQAYDLTSFTERRRGPGSLGRYYLILLSGLVLVAVITAAAIIDPVRAFDAVGNVAVFGVIALGLGIGVTVIVASLRKQARLRKITVAAAPTGIDAQAPRVLDGDEPERMAPAPGWAGLGLHLRFAIDRYPPEAIAALTGREKPTLMQRWRTVRIGEPEAPRCRPWVPAPEVLLDGRAVPVGWTRMWMQLPPGEHELTVRVSAPPGQIGPETALDLSRAEYRHRFRTEAGRNTDIALCADITAVPAPDTPRLAAYRVHLTE